MKWDDILTLLSVGGFASQRTLELLDPLVVLVSTRLKAGLDQPAAKAWWMTVGGFVIGLAIVIGIPHLILPGGMKGPWSYIVLALAISVGTNAANSLVKYGEYAKEARKIEVQPLPIVTVAPASVAIARGSSIQFLVTVSGTDNKDASWILLEGNSGGTIDPKTGLYTAPAQPGTYHVAARSTANAAATAMATITVS